MGRKSTHNLPPGIQLDRHGAYWATLVDEDAKLWRKRYPGRSVPRRKAPMLKEAFRLQQQLIADLKATRDPNADNPKVVDWVRTCIGHKRKLAESSRERYNQALVCQIEPFRIGRMRVQEVLKRHVEDWVDELIAQPLRADTIKTAFAVLRMSFNMAVADDMLGKNPCAGVELPQRDQEEIHPLEIAQVNALLHMLDTYDKGKPHRNAALYHVAIRCGLRLSELIGLRRKDIDLHRRVLYVAGQLKEKAHTVRGKTPRARRAVPLSADTVDALRWHMGNQDEEKALGGKEWNAAGLLFCSERGTPIRPANLRRQLNSLLNRAGIPHIHVHGLRHTYAALSIAAGVDIYTLSRRMGHSSIALTGDRYGHLYQGNTQDADALDRLLKRSA